MKPTTQILVLSGVLAVGLLLSASRSAHAQSTPKVFFACYVPNTGTVYRIKEPGLRVRCTQNHIEFSWIDGVPDYDHGFLNGRADDDHPQYLLANGTRALAGDLNLGGFRITGVAAGAAAGHAVRFEQAVKVGDVAGGDLLGNFPNALRLGKLLNAPVSSTAASPTSGQVLTFDGSTWTPTTPSQGVTDHGQLTGLPDDDHPQYLLADGTRPLAGNLSVSGNVGIGTTTPSAALHINNPDVNWVSFTRPLIIGGDENVAPAIQIGYGGSTERWGIGSNYAGKSLQIFSTGSDAAFGGISKWMTICGGALTGCPGGEPFGVTVHRNLNVGQDLNVSGSKNFVIPHPSRPDARLVHAALEGPEIAVYYRGDGRLSDGRAFVQLPSYFEALTRPEGRTVQLTAKGSSPYVLSASEVREGGFWVYGTVSDGAFFWEVRAVRADIAPLVVEQCDGDLPCR